jgi:carboxymethylenebutenolidase
MNAFQKYLAEEFAEDYEDGRISRRDALRLIASVTGSLVVADGLVSACTPPIALAVPSPTAIIPVSNTPVPAGTPAPYGTVMPDDPAIQTSQVEFTGRDKAKLMAYLARPAGNEQSAAILVCHENRGLTEHIKDVTRRVAKAGYVALAVDLLSRKGGTAALDQNDIPGILANTLPDQMVQDFIEGWNYLKSQPFVNSKMVGMVGFCFGGGMTWLVTEKLPDLKASTPFYGPIPPVEEVPNINAAVLAFYGGKDARIDAGIPTIEEAMKKNNKIYEKVIYPDADHAFFNDTGTRYNPDAAKDAWGRMLAWFQKYLV